MESIHLYRPVGVKELELIKNSNWLAFPDRLSYQPIFYPVLTFEYAELIISHWNINENESGYAGFITKFNVEKEYVQRFKVETAGGPTLQELWIPAEELSNFNKHIISKIKIVAAFYGQLFQGEKIEISNETNNPPSQMYINPSQFIKSENDYQDWLKKSDKYPKK